MTKAYVEFINTTPNENAIQISLRNPNNIYIFNDGQIIVNGIYCGLSTNILVDILKNNSDVKKAVADALYDKLKLNTADAKDKISILEKQIGLAAEYSDKLDASKSALVGLSERLINDVNNKTITAIGELKTAVADELMKQTGGAGVITQTNIGELIDSRVKSYATSTNNSVSSEAAAEAILDITNRGIKQSFEKYNVEKRFSDKILNAIRDYWVSKFANEHTSLNDTSFSFYWDNSSSEGSKMKQYNALDDDIKKQIDAKALPMFNSLASLVYTEKTPEDEYSFINTKDNYIGPEKKGFLLESEVQKVKDIISEDDTIRTWGKICYSKSLEKFSIYFYKNIKYENGETIAQKTDIVIDNIVYSGEIISSSGTESYQDEDGFKWMVKGLNTVEGKVENLNETVSNQQNQIDNLSNTLSASNESKNYTLDLTTNGLMLLLDDNANGSRDEGEAYALLSHEDLKFVASDGTTLQVMKQNIGTNGRFTIGNYSFIPTASDGITLKYMGE